MPPTAFNRSGVAGIGLAPRTETARLRLASLLQGAVVTSGARGLDQPPRSRSVKAIAAAGLRCLAALMK